MSAENIVQNSVLLAIGSHPNVRVFRQNTGKVWAGELVKLTPDLVILKNPRPFHAGLCKGSSDLIGWRVVTVTPEMVGQKLAIFTALEVKTATGRPSDEQIKFIDNVNAAGGIAGVVRSPEEAKQLVKI